MTPILAGMINDSGKRQETMLVEVVAVDAKLFLSMWSPPLIYPFRVICFRFPLALNLHPKSAAYSTIPRPRPRVIILFPPPVE
jgi:hypothetical protein